MKRITIVGALFAALAVSGCTALFDPDRLSYVDDAGPADAGSPVDAGADVDAGRDAAVDAAVDAGRDAGPGACGQIGEACCDAPRPACVSGANCTLEGCQPCGAPGQACCDDGAACQVTSCVPGRDVCPPVTELVQVPVPSGGTYGIDAFEVSRTQYETWLETSPTPAGALIGPGCAWNTDLRPDAACVAAGFDCTGAGCAQRPQTCVDWCDAYAYCAAVGKRLCGRYAGDSALPMGSFSDASVSPWYNACSSGGMFLYPTGDSSRTADAECNFTDRGASADVESLTGCQSSVPGYEGVLALTGNVREWLNGCTSNTAMDARCLAVGGAYLDNDAFEGQCNYPNDLPRTFANASTGFRCCEVR